MRTAPVGGSQSRCLGLFHKPGEPIVLRRESKAVRLAPSHVDGEGEVVERQAKPSLIAVTTRSHGLAGARPTSARPAGASYPGMGVPGFLWYFYGMRITIDKAGRLVIPKPLRDQTGIGSGEVEIFAEGTGLHLEPCASADLVREGDRLVVPSAGARLTSTAVRELLDAGRR
ncbi:MAG: AbrB/MazE/SpoVT family DNA-binding domain-containing protein [Acidimicrobiales bacterium]